MIESPEQDQAVVMQEQAAPHESISDVRQDVLPYSRKRNGYMWVIFSTGTELSTQASQGSPLSLAIASSNFLLALFDLPRYGSRLQWQASGCRQ
jgi:hypothetical protein